MKKWLLIPGKKPKANQNTDIPKSNLMNQCFSEFPYRDMGQVLLTKAEIVQKQMHHQKAISLRVPLSKADGSQA